MKRYSVFPPIQRIPAMAMLAGGLVVSAAGAIANEALDILEGRRSTEDVVLPPEPGRELEGNDEAAISPGGSAWGKSTLDPILSRAVLFSDPENTWIQELAIQGLFQWSGVWGNAENDVPGSGARRREAINSLRARRLRLGARVKAFCNTEIVARAEFAGPGAYSGIDEIKARIEVARDTHVSFGKMRPEFSIEYSMPPGKLPTPERSALVDQLSPARTLGLMVDSRRGPWDYGLGWFSGAADSGIPSFSGNGFLLAKLGYTGIDRTDGRDPLSVRWHLDYIYNFDGDESGSIPRFRVPAGTLSANGGRPVTQPSFRHIVSTGVEIRQERMDFAGDFLLGHGGAANLWGLTLMPSYWIVPGTLRIVGRYHYADTDTPGGIVTGLGRDPYFDMSSLYTGDEYHSFYLGANLHIHRNNVVLMSGLEYAMLKDQSGGGFDTNFTFWHAALRISF